eukprot:2631949-Lingulodinium_polyedra.AAC.1
MRDFRYGLRKAILFDEANPIPRLGPAPLVPGAALLGGPWLFHHELPQIPGLCVGRHDDHLLQHVA